MTFSKRGRKPSARQTTSFKNSTWFLKSVFVERWTAHYENVQRGHYYSKYSHREHVTKHLISIFAKAHSFSESCAGNSKDRLQWMSEKLAFSHKNWQNGWKNVEDMDVSGEICSKASGTDNRLPAGGWAELTSGKMSFYEKECRDAYIIALSLFWHVFLFACACSHSPNH